jgi:hypothetical protein
MQSHAPRSRVRELELLARLPEAGASNLGEYVACHADALAQELDVDAHELAVARALDDEELLPRILRLLERARGRRARADGDRRRVRSIAAAIRLGETARWTDVGAELDLDLLLGDVLACRVYKWISFETDGLTAVIPRHLVAAAVPLARQHLDLAAFVDEHGWLQFRWRGGRGRYRWKPHAIRPGMDRFVLSIPLKAKVVEPFRRLEPHVVVEAAVSNDVAVGVEPLPTNVPVASSPQHRGGGPWLLREILRELGHL